MTKTDQKEFKKLILDALKSKEGQDAIKSGTVEALKSEEGKDIMVKNFVEGYHDVVEPILEEISHDIKTLKIEVRYIRDNHGTRIERLERKVGLGA